MLYHHQMTEHEAYDDMYENEWRQNNLGAVKYSHAHANIMEKRPVYSTINGYPVPLKDHFFTPCPWWIWCEDWHLDESLNLTDGWLYLEHWYSDKASQNETTKMRLRRWIRKRLLIKVKFS